MKFGAYEIETFNHGYFRLDGGSMFGAVPKNLWNRLLPADEENRIRLATRSLLIRTPDRLLLVDTGNGTKWDEKRARIFGIEPAPASSYPFRREEITDLVLTHLHFDHAGGVSEWNEQGEPVLMYPNAAHYVQQVNFELAKNPNVRERASYLPENVFVLEQANLRLLDGTEEIIPGVLVHRVNGHTQGQQIIEIRISDRTLFYPTDLIPTSHHVSLPYHMGYDMCVETLLEEKSELLARAVAEKAIVVFEHDPTVAAATIRTDERGRYQIDQELKF